MTNQTSTQFDELKVNNLRTGGREVKKPLFSIKPMCLAKMIEVKLPNEINPAPTIVN